MTDLLQGNDDAFHFTAEDVRQRDDSTAAVDDLIAELAEEANKSFWCVVEMTQAPDHAHTAQNQGQNLGDVLQTRKTQVLTYSSSQAGSKSRYIFLQMYKMRLASSVCYVERG